MIDAIRLLDETKSLKQRWRPRSSAARTTRCHSLHVRLGSSNCVITCRSFVMYTCLRQSTLPRFRLSLYRYILPIATRLFPSAVPSRFRLSYSKYNIPVTYIPGMHNILYVIPSVSCLRRSFPSAYQVPGIISYIEIPNYLYCMVYHPRPLAVHVYINMIYMYISAGTYHIGRLFAFLVIIDASGMYRCVRSVFTSVVSVCHSSTT